jgi:hypothetical protein
MVTTTDDMTDRDHGPESEQRVAARALRQQTHVAESQRDQAERRETDLARAMLRIAEALEAAVASGDDVAVAEAAIRAAVAIRLRCQEIAR